MEKGMPNEPTFHFPKAQRGEIMYPQFTRQALAAGCVGYFVQISGKCIQYFGRNGEIHTEWFLQQSAPESQHLYCSRMLR